MVLGVDRAALRCDVMELEVSEMETVNEVYLPLVEWDV
jgi:hypothetical protein